MSLVLIIVAVTACLAISSTLYKRYQRARVRKAYGPLLPPKNRLSWSAKSCAESRRIAAIGHEGAGSLLASGDVQAKRGQSTVTSSALRVTLPFWPSATDGFIQALPVFHDFMSVDSNVLRAIEFSTADHIHHLPTVHDYIEARFFLRLADQPATAEGWLHRLEGYVGEQKAAEVLHNAGHKIQFPETSNQPDCDFSVDGHPAQVKIGVDAQHVREFVNQHPDIDVYTSPDIAAQIDDPQVHGLASLDHDHIAQTTHGALGGLHDGFHAGIGFPLVTFVTSSLKELDLLADGKTTVTRAATNVTVNTGSVAAGLWVGIKSGAALGAFGGPHGAAAGAIIWDSGCRQWRLRC